MFLEAATALLNTKGGAGLGQGLGAALGGGGPTTATSGAYGTSQDGSGWSVNFSGVQSASSSQDKAGGGGLLSGPSIGGVPWWVLAGGVGLIVWMRKRKK